MKQRRRRKQMAALNSRAHVLAWRHVRDHRVRLLRNHVERQRILDAGMPLTEAQYNWIRQHGIVDAF